MNIETLKAKHGVEFITITNDVGLEVVLSNYGASIYQLKMDLEEMILTPKSFETFFHNTKYYGLTIGRIAGRTKNGLLKVGDKTYQLEQNEGTNSLHGGFHSIAFKKWRTQLTAKKEYIIVRFYLTTKKGEAGYNGKCQYIVSYKYPAYNYRYLKRYSLLLLEAELSGNDDRIHLTISHYVVVHL